MTIRSANSRKPASRLGKNPYAKLGYQYAHNVISGKIPACLYVRQACQRSIDDFNNQGKVGFQYRFDADLADRICKFVENLPHVRGDHSGDLIRLEPYQAWILGQTNGWRDPHGNRRFRNVLIIVPKGNGKSTLASGIVLYMLTADGKQADVRCAATTRDQANIVFGDAQQMARKSPALCNAFGIDVLAHDVIVPKTNSSFRAVSSEAKTLDGMNLSCGVIDELAAHPNGEVYDAVVSGAGKRTSSLIFSITTAGSNMMGPGYQQQDYLRAVLNGAIKDDHQFGCIWTIDDEDDWTTDEALIKANPGWGVSVNPTYVLGQRTQALNTAARKPNFQQKHLNIWTAADAQFFDMAAWARNTDTSLTLEQFKGQPVWIGLDLATKHDLSARVLLFTKMIEGVKHYYLFGRAYLPASACRGNATYQGWEMEGRLCVTQGEVTDYNFIYADIHNDCAAYQVQKIGVDPYQANWIMNELMQTGAPAYLYNNNVSTMSAPMKELAALISSGRLHHNGDPVLAWCISNVVAHYDTKENVMPRKNLESQKKDLADATIFALGMEMAEQPILDGEIYFVPFR